MCHGDRLQGDGDAPDDGALRDRGPSIYRSIASVAVLQRRIRVALGPPSLAARASSVAVLALAAWTRLTLVVFVNPSFPTKSSTHGLLGDGKGKKRG